jgi:hypothetical protein
VTTETPDYRSREVPPGIVRRDWVERDGSGRPSCDRPPVTRSSAAVRYVNIGITNSPPSITAAAVSAPHIFERVVHNRV